MAIKIAGSNNITERGVQHTKRASERGELKFGEQLKSVSTEKHRETLVGLTKSIIEQGEVVAEKCDIKEFKKYKELIADFFREMTSSGYEFSRDESMDARGRKRLYANIKRVNTDMEKLATELLKTQKNQVEILTMVEDIRGIIIDILA